MPNGSSPPMGHVSRGGAVYCKLCLCEVAAAAATRLLSCGCTFCTTCVQQYVQLAIREGGGVPITCPDRTCEGGGAMLDSEISTFAPLDQVQLYQQLKFAKGVQLDPTKVWCPAVECQAVCSTTPDAREQATCVTCPACNTSFCSICRSHWRGGHTCSELQSLILPVPAESGKAEALIKQCPGCAVYIERNQGCAQMLCKSCKHTFCWHCLQNLDGDIFLTHYDKGPCRNKLGHSRASVIWNRTQIVGLLLGVSILMLVTSPLLLIASPCILCCVCKPCRGKKNTRERKRQHKKKNKGQLQ